jgi:hypothetical protein
LDRSSSQEYGKTVARAMQYFRAVYAARCNIDGVTHHQSVYAGAVLRQWQEDALALTTVEPDSRKFHWFWDAEGNTGKSWFAGYLVANHNALVFTNGKLADMAYVITNQPIVIFDLARTSADKIDHVYTAIECLKNGRIFSPKYESQAKFFKPPHVFVFANFVPDEYDRYTKLSRDRWSVIDISS